ncbi:hypothetical protein KDU71_08855 [Carboxylicivirga sediminis]|uniref:Porin n=1 Tax=Carboxylicivirga sediminis TaxID=2006564 RepID=A0A941IWC5_9BACT|nr:hypothetical protein [Carboxylicivirga sediminis]MBR8535666.1 hypothetical protein [Carboxylicivirga sediminis]
MRGYILALLLLTTSFTFAGNNIQDSITSVTNQYPGLGKAASGIFYSDKPWSVSGFGEINTVTTPGYTPDKDALGDIELYYSNLYRLATFFGYRFNDKLIINSELQVEYLSSGQESHTEINFELFMDYRFNKAFNLRAGFHPLGIGYINSNDEPILFYSVNRPETERLILPSTWIELGLAAYGQLSPSISYFTSVVTALDAQHFRSATWVRNGREAFDLNSLAWVGQLNYTNKSGLDLNISGYYGSNGNDAYQIEDASQQLNSKLSLLSGYARYARQNFRVLAAGTYGWLSDSYGVYHLTSQDSNNGQVLGSQVFGAYTEAGVDILHWLWRHRKDINKTILDTHEMKWSFFVRYEHLNTHHKVDSRLSEYPRIQNYMNILALGTNINLTEDIVIKANYQFRQNLTPSEFSIPTGNCFEFGLGFNF